VGRWKRALASLYRPHNLLVSCFVVWHGASEFLQGKLINMRAFTSIFRSPEAAPGVTWDTLRTASSQPNAQEIYVRALDHGPIFHDAEKDQWLVLGNSEVWFCLKTKEVFRADVQVSFDAVLKGDDAKVDASRRKLLFGAISRVTGDQITSFAELWLAGFSKRVADRGVFDAVAHLAIPLPDAYAGVVLGLGEEDLSRLAGSRRANRTDIVGVQSRVAEVFASILRHGPSGLKEGFCRELAGAIRKGAISEEVAVSLCEVMWFGITVPTGNAIPSLVARLIREQDAARALLGHPEKAPGFVAEVLRLESPTSYVRRVTASNVELAGQRIPRGKRVILYLAAANVSPEVFPDPLCFDPDRDQSASLAFGGGLHFCLGAGAARSMLAAVAGYLVRTYAELRCSVSPERYEFEDSNMRALKSLPVTCLRR
jgi:cytochrome P450